MIKNKKIKKFLMINLGVMGAALAFSLFLSPNNLVVGGIGGLSINIVMIIQKYFDNISNYTLDTIKSIIILVINLVLLLLGFILVNKEFALNTLYCSIAYPFYSWIFSSLYNLLKVGNWLVVNQNDTGQVLIIICFAALLSGTSIGFVIKHGSSTGGVDIIEQIFFEKLNIPYSYTLFVCDGLIVLMACFLKQNIYALFYGIIYIFISGKMIDAVVFAGFKSCNVTIITAKSEELKNAIINKIHRGLTIVDAVGGYSDNNLKMIISVMSNSEANHIRSIVKEVDPNAFMYVTRTSEVNGIGFTKDR